MGDGAFNMCYPDVITNVQYDLPVINVVFSNEVICLHQGLKYRNTSKHLFGCDFPNADYAKIAEAQRSYWIYSWPYRRLSTRSLLKLLGVNKEGKTVVIDVASRNTVTSSKFLVDPKQHSRRSDQKPSKEKREAEELVPFRLFLEEGLQSRAINNPARRKSNVNCVIFTLPLLEYCLRFDALFILWFS